jgi:hypothetical protein
MNHLVKRSSNSHHLLPEGHPVVVHLEGSTA